VAYQTECHWPPPLPVDKLVKLNELQMKMDLGLESRRGALEELGNEFPDEKANEIFEERRKDVLENGALEMLNALIDRAIVQSTGISMQNGNAGGPSSGTNSGSTVPAPENPVANQATVASGIEREIYTELVTQAFGYKQPSRRNPDNETAEGFVPMTQSVTIDENQVTVPESTPQAPEASKGPIFTAEDIERVRQEEKSKLYNRLAQAEERLSAMSKQLEEVLAER